MYANSLTHRNDLFDLATRWWADRPLPGDGLFLTRVLAYETLITGPEVLGLIQWVRQGIHPGTMALKRIRSKDEFRDLLVRSCADPGPREAELFAAFREFPEEFYPGTPTDAMVGFRENGEVLGMMRFKRIRRVADKTSRRIADALAGVIQDTAQELARERAHRLGLRIGDLRSSPAEMAGDFHQAERIVSRSFKHGLLAFKREQLQIDDGIGIKVVGTPEELSALEERIFAFDSVISVQREEHKGTYNDINLLVDLRLPAPGTIVERMAGWDWRHQAGCGLSPEELAAGFPAWVDEGERSFRVEVILTTREDLVESEFGASIHEARIQDQRTKAAYAGRIASNASFIARYMAMVALSPTIEVESLPVKMWGRYLPDAYAKAIWKLFHATREREQLLPLDTLDGFTSGVPALFPIEGASTDPGAPADPMWVADLA